MKKSVEDRRAEIRGKAKIAVEFLHNGLEDAVAETRDYTDIGVLVESMPGMEILQPGMELKLRITGIMCQAPLLVETRVVRIGDDEIAFQFKRPVAAG